MDAGLQYDNLLKSYKELQNRVTRFSSIEQDLINTRDRLDHELILYKRLNNFISEVLSPIPTKDFYQLICEAVVDIFELESALFIIKKNTAETIEIYNEGLNDRLKDEEIRQVADKWFETYNEEQTILLPSFNISSGETVSRGILSVFYNKDADAQFCIAGLVFKKLDGVYPNISVNRQTIFGIFIRYLYTIISNKFNNLKIEDQISQILASKRELEKLSLIATKTDTGIIIADNQGRVDWINEAFAKLSGYRLEEIKGKKPREFLHGPDTDVELSEKIGKELRNRNKVDEIITNYNKDGHKYFSHLQITPVFDENNELINFIALQKDITSERDYQEQLVRSNSKFELITNKLQIGIWEWDVQSNHVIWNETLVNQYGKQALLEADFFEYWKKAIHPEDAAHILNLTDKLINGTLDLIETEYRIIRHDTRTISYLKCVTVAERNSEGKLLRLVGSSVDITHVKNAEAERDGYLQAINGLKQFYENVISHLPSAVTVLDDSFNIVYSNKDTGIDDLIIFNANQAIKENKLFSFEKSNTKDETFSLVSILPYRVNDELQNIIVVSTDISDIKRFEIDLINKNNELKKTNSELDSFVYSVSHDLRTPLLSLKGLLELIIEANEIPTETGGLIEMAMESVLRLDNTIQEILEYSRNSRLNIDCEKFDVEELAHNIFEDVKYSVDQKVSFSVEIKGSKFICADKGRIKVLLSNLIANAVKYRNRNISNPYVKFSMITYSDKYEIIVEDNGEGISEESLPKVFDMFYRASNTSVGTGLGLYICKEIITKLNGNIKVDSAVGMGSIFKISLPFQSNITSSP